MVAHSPNDQSAREAPQARSHSILSEGEIEEAAEAARKLLQAWPDGCFLSGKINVGLIARALLSSLKQERGSGSASPTRDGPASTEEVMGENSLFSTSMGEAADHISQECAKVAALFEGLPREVRVRRPVVRWFGGKWKMAPTIIKHFPAHRIYVEPFGGGGSVLLRKQRSYAEIYNDMDTDVVNLFRVLRDDELATRLVQQLELTPFSREEFKASYALTDEPVERARRLITLSLLGFGSNAHARRSTGFRANSNRSGTTPAHDWRNYPEALALAIDRLRGVIIENRDATEVMAQHDGPKTLHYVDPPYVHSTRGRSDKQRQYTHEMDDDQHRALLGFLCTLQGHVVLSGYAHPIYDEALTNWRRVEFNALADGALPRTEVLWIKNAKAA